MTTFLSFIHLNHVTLYRIAWSATFICVLIPWGVAKTTALQKHPRLYTAMALLACVWMLVLVLYVAPEEIQTPRERQAVSIAGDIAAVLLVYIGGLLAAEAQQTPGGGPVGIARAQKAALWLLFFIALLLCHQPSSLQIILAN
jgi:hypothetical protein